jgi:hypothetical protein
LVPGSTCCCSRKCTATEITDVTEIHTSCKPKARCGSAVHQTLQTMHQ